MAEKILLNTLLNNPKVEKLIPTALKPLVGVVQENVLPSLSPELSSIPEPDIVSESVSSSIFSHGFLISILLLIWAGFLIYMILITQDTNKKDNYKSIHQIVFGNIGIFTTLILLWFAITIVSFLPSISALLPRILETVGSIGAVLAK